MAEPAFSLYSGTLHDLLSRVEVTDSAGNQLSIEEGIARTIKAISSKRSDEKKILVIGNGGSAAIASHMQNDLCKAVGVRALVFNEAPLLTALSNDLAYSAAFGCLVDLWADSGDLMIAISSSGQSENIIRAADAANRKGCHVISFSGFRADNPLRKLGIVNYYIPSDHYGYVELGHSVLTHYITDTAPGVIENLLH